MSIIKASGQNLRHSEYMDHYSPNIDNNPMLLEISPLSYNQVTEINKQKAKVSALRKDNKQGINSSSVYQDNESARKIDFYPSQEIDSIDIQITNQQKSYDASDILASLPNMLQNMSKPTEESKLIRSLEGNPGKIITSNSSQSSFADSDQDLNEDDEDCYEEEEDTS